MDGERVGKLRPWESTNVLVPPGIHNVQAKVSTIWTPPLIVTFPPGGRVNVTMHSRPFLRCLTFWKTVSARFWLSVPLVEAHDYPPDTPLPPGVWK